jgi:hypothetical protein
MIRLTCHRCRGSGEVPNEQYEICQSLKNEQVQRYFRMKTGEEGEPEENVLQDGGCEMARTVGCPVCDGEGVLEFDEEDWDLRVIDDEEEGDDAGPASLPPHA